MPFWKKIYMNFNRAYLELYVLFWQKEVTDKIKKWDNAKYYLSRSKLNDNPYGKTPTCRCFSIQFTQRFLSIIHCTTKKFITRVIWSFSCSCFMYYSYFLSNFENCVSCLLKIVIFESWTEKYIFFVLMSIKTFQNFSRAANLCLFICHTWFVTFSVHKLFTKPVFRILRVEVGQKNTYR